MPVPGRRSRAHRDEKGNDSMRMHPGRRRTGVLAAAVAAVMVTATACGTEDTPTPQLSGPVVIDGSSTVQPLSQAAAQLFTREHPQVQINIAVSGTGGGFTKFCDGAIDIANASRPITDDEKQRCAANGIDYSYVRVANDALTVVVPTANTWAQCLTVAQLRAIWEPGSTVRTWKDIDPAFPDEPLALFGPGPDSGTFDLFTEAVVGHPGASRTDYQASEDDTAGVAAGRGGMGYFGYSYYEDNTDTLRAVRIDNGGGCVEPSASTAQDRSYAPLSRPLFLYVSDNSVTKPQVAAFAAFHVDSSTIIADTAGFIALTSAQLTNARAELADLEQRSRR